MDGEFSQDGRLRHTVNRPAQTLVGVESDLVVAAVGAVITELDQRPLAGLSKYAAARCRRPATPCIDSAKSPMMPVAEERTCPSRQTASRQETARSRSSLS